MNKYCTKCGAEIEEACKYCTECGVMTVDKSKFTYSNKSMNNPTYYMGSGNTCANERYGKLVKYINATFAIGIGVVIAFVALLVWISL